MGLFGIGTFQSLSGGTTYSDGGSSSSSTTAKPPFQVVPLPPPIATELGETYDYYSRLLTITSGPTSGIAPIGPYSGTSGGTYGYVLDTRVRAPSSVVWTPAPEIGLDATGISIIRGWPAMTWTYNTLRPDYWYYLYTLYQQSARELGPFQYLVLLQYPDPQNSGAISQNLARWDPPAQSYRTVGAYFGVTLNFTYIGYTTLSPSTQIVTLS